jgi:hypothetical protein
MTIHGTGLLWDPQKGQIAAEFINRKIETDDPRIIELAKLNGLRIEGELKPELVLEKPKETLMEEYSRRGRGRR